MDGNKKILIIEDEQILGEVLLGKLKEEGFETYLETDGESGLRTMREIMPDLVLLDIVMPKMDGYEVLEAVHKDESLNKIPVIIISNSGQPIELTRVLELGARDYIIKTQFGPEDVIGKVRKYIYGEETPEAEEHKKESGVKIMMVEDDSFLSSLAAGRLSKEGYAVTVAADGIQALKKLETEVPDLVLLDIIMPGMNGFELLKKMKEDPRLKDISVVIFSNVGQEHEIEEARTLGADAYLVKSQVTPKEVTMKVEEILKKKGRL